MKKRNYFLVFSTMLISLISFVPLCMKAQVASLEVTLANDVVIDSSHYAFDVYVKSTNNAGFPAGFPYGNGAYKWTFNTAIKNGVNGRVIGFIVANSTELTNVNQANNTVTSPSATLSYFRIPTRSPVPYTEASIISSTGFGTKIFRFMLVSRDTVAHTYIPFTIGTKANITLTIAAPSGTLVTYVVPAGTVSNASPAVLVNTNLLNPILYNPPTIYFTTGSGSYCQGSGGLPVGLSNSQFGVNYTLIKNGTPTSSVVAGSGAAITFGNQFFGTYTISGTSNGSAPSIIGTTTMLGTALIIENPLATASAGPDSPVCQNSSFTVSLAEANGYVSLHWTNSGTGTLTGETTLTPTFVLSAGETGTITLTLTAIGPGSCNASSQMTLTVISPVAGVSPASQEIIAPDTTTEVYFTSLLEPAIFNWTGIASSPLVGGYYFTGTGSTLPAQILSSSSPTIQTVTYTIVPETSGCTGPSATHIVTVYPYPTAPVTEALEVAASPNALVKVPVQVKGANSITSLSLRLDYNPEHATYQSMADANPSFAGLVVNEVSVSPTLHRIMLSWSDIMPVVISEKTTVARLVFHYFSDTTQLVWNNISSTGQDCEFTDETGEPLNDLPTWFCYHNGLIYPGYSLSGTFTYLNASYSPLDSIKIYLHEYNFVKDSTITSLSGEYAFTGMDNGTYLVDAHCTKPWSGVNSTDAAKIQRHFTGIEVLTEPIKLLAGDVNNSNFINATDALQVKRRFAGLTNYFLRGDWAFAKNVSGGDTLVINGANLSQDFYGLCVGDVNGSNIPDAGGKKSAGMYLGNSGTIKVAPGEVFEVPVKAVYPMQLSAISMVIPYPAEYFEAMQVTMGGLDPVYNIVNGEIRIAWSEMENLGLKAGDALLKMKFRAKETFEGNLSVELRPTAESELADENGEAIQAPELSSLTIVTMKANGLPGDNTHISSCSVFPNPARDIVNIELKLETRAAITCQILDATGREIGTVEEKEFEQGIARIGIATGQYSAGIYQLRIRVGTKDKSLHFIEKLLIQK